MKYLLAIVFFSFGMSTYGQDLEKIGGSALALSGNISIGSSYYKAVNRDNRRSPYSYYITANPTLSIYGIDIPISLVYRDQKGSISNPFNRASIHPRYKWIALHFGKSSYNMHPYGLSGQLINGKGIELTPGKFRLSVAQGSMGNPLAQLDTIVEGAEILDTYKRNALAAKIGFGSSSNYLDLSVFQAKDDVNSIDRSLINERIVKPEENIVLGTALGISPLSWIALKANLAASAHTANQETKDVFQSADITKLKEDLGDIITLNFSSKLQFAGDASLDFKFRHFSIGAQYKRVDPFYKSLGAYYFLEDYENYLARCKFSLFNGKFIINAKGGLQRNNLNNLRSVTNSRKVYSASAIIKISNVLSVAANYSNFQTERSPGLVAVNDTLRYARANANYGVNPRINLGGKNNRSSISMSLRYQNLQDLIRQQEADDNIENYNASITYSLAMRASHARISFTALGNQNLIRDKERKRIGGKMAYSKRFLKKKLSMRSSLSYTQNFMNEASDGQSITGRLSLSYNVKKKYRTSLIFNYLNRRADNSYQEYRGNFKLTILFPKKSRK